MMADAVDVPESSFLSASDEECEAVENSAIEKQKKRLRLKS